MKYFRYPFYSRLKFKEKTLRNSNLTAEERKTNRVAYTFGILLFALFIALIVGFVFLIKHLNKIIENDTAIVFVNIGLGIAVVIVPIAILALIYKRIPEKYENSIVGKLTSENRKQLAKILIDYYKVYQPLVITKCYRSTNDFFTGKDVAIFYFRGMVRITLDFENSFKDAGCYEFDKEDFTIAYVEENGKTMAFLKSNKIDFYLGKSAKPFIEKCFRKSKCPCCGNYTFLEIDRGLNSICPVCFWEDDLDQEEDPTLTGGPNAVCLLEARENYKKFGACEERLINYCRPPKNSEKQKQ